VGINILRPFGAMEFNWNNKINRNTNSINYKTRRWWWWQCNGYKFTQKPSIPPTKW